MQPWLSHLTEGTTPAIAAILVPIVFAIFSRRLSVVFGTFVLALASICIFLAPLKAPEIIAISFYVGSLIIAASGIIARQKARALQTEIDRLREAVNNLSAAAERQLLLEIRRLPDEEKNRPPQKVGNSKNSEGRLATVSASQ